MTDELEQFQTDLLESVRQMKSAQASRVTAVSLLQGTESQRNVGVSQQVFTDRSSVATGKNKVHATVSAKNVGLAFFMLRDKCLFRLLAHSDRLDVVAGECGHALTDWKLKLKK
jgi:hypothetical protein